MVMDQDTGNEALGGEQERYAAAEGLQQMLRSDILPAVQTRGTTIVGETAQVLGADGVSVRTENTPTRRDLANRPEVGYTLNLPGADQPNALTVGINGPDLSVTLYPNAIVGAQGAQELGIFWQLVTENQTQRNGYNPDGVKRMADRLKQMVTEGVNVTTEMRMPVGTAIRMEGRAAKFGLDLLNNLNAISGNVAQRVNAPGTTGPAPASHA